MRKSLTIAVVLVLVFSEAALAGPFWWLFGRRRRRVYYQQPQYYSAPAEAAEPPPAEETELTQHAVIQALHAADTQYRNNAGLDGLQLHSKLCEIAQAHAWNMANTGSFSHYLGGSPWDRAFAAGWPNSASENIAMGYRTTGDCYRGWYGSVGHRNNMLGDHTFVGFGYAVNSRGTAYWVAMYSD